MLKIEEGIFILINCEKKEFTTIFHFLGIFKLFICFINFVYV